MASEGYAFHDEPPPPEAYVDLRELAGMSPRTIEAAERGLPNSLYAVTVWHHDSVVGMGRVIGDCGSFYQLVDVAVHPEHQGKGLGTEIVQRLMDYLHANAPSSAYVSLIADVDGFYERFGFEDTLPESKGMALHIE